MIKIQKIDPSKVSERGSNRFFSVRKTEYIVVLNRNEGSVSGKHYHTGRSLSKSPEILYLVKGKIKIITKDVKTGKTEEYEAEENSLIEIPIGIYHEVHALTDAIILELCTDRKDFENQDTFKS